MADYRAELVRVRTLFDGSQVAIRPIRREDAPMEQDFVRYLSPASRHARFMVTLTELPASKLKSLTEIDYEHHLALVVVVRRDGGEVEVGVARYVVGPTPDTCEFAIAVDDAWQVSLSRVGPSLPVPAKIRGRGLCGLAHHEAGHIAATRCNRCRHVSRRHRRRLGRRRAALARAGGGKDVE